MRYTRAQINGLIKITEATFAAEQARMIRLSEREADLRGTLAEMRRALHTRAVDPTQDAAIRAGADLKWEAWVDHRIAALNIELAKVLMEKQNVRSALKQAFGKYQVAEHFAQDARKARIKAADARDERGY